MKKLFLYTAPAVMLLAVSCKEHTTPIPKDEGKTWDTSYVDNTPVTPQSKHILVEELSGVTCPNCPAGTEQLELLAQQNPDLLRIVTIHTGALTAPINGKSKQDFRTEDGNQLRSLIWNGEGSKPTAVFDRRELATSVPKMFVSPYTNWPNAITQCKTLSNNSTPINIEITSTYNSTQDRYDIEAIVKYTSEVAGQQALNIFLIENGIIDAQEYSPEDIDENYEFNHIFRKAITGPTGRIYLKDLATKEAGRVYKLTTSLKIDNNIWKPENMKLIAFVSAADGADKHVFQVVDVNLK